MMLFRTKYTIKDLWIIVIMILFGIIQSTMYLEWSATISESEIIKLIVSIVFTIVIYVITLLINKKPSVV